MTRKSKREIERVLDKIDDYPHDEYPRLDTLAELLGYDWEEVEGEDELRRRADTGEIYYFPEGAQDAFVEAFSDEDRE